nr:uncharacterized protein LOC132438361 isoform X2 [Delphinus delphis]
MQVALRLASKVRKQAVVPRDRLVDGQGFRGSRLSGCWCTFYKMTSAQEERNHRVTMKGQLEGCWNVRIGTGLIRQLDVCRWMSALLLTRITPGLQGIGPAGCEAGHRAVLRTLDLSLKEAQAPEYRGFVLNPAKRKKWQINTTGSKGRGR